MQRLGYFSLALSIASKTKSSFNDSKFLFLLQQNLRYKYLYFSASTLSVASNAAALFPREGNRRKQGGCIGAGYLVN